MKNIVLIPNPVKDVGLRVTEKIVKKLISLGVQPVSWAVPGLEKIDGLRIVTEEPDSADAVVVIGGDGSVIDASGLAIRLNAPLLGVNLGRVGYLTECEPDNLSQLERLAGGDYEIANRLLLHTELIDACGNVTSSERLAVNDVVISQDGYFGIANFTVENSRSECVKYRGNGVIVATPIGSTAYSLSAGGPIISHGLDSITVTPVCPHSFFNRSIIFEPGEVITICNTGDLALNISIDGRSFATLNTDERCRIYQSSHKLKMITFTTNNMFTALFDKIRALENNV